MTKIIQIITKKDQLRYIGDFYNINPIGKIVALKNIRCYGTENRQVEKLVEPSKDLIDFMEFPGVMIQ